MKDPMDLLTKLGTLVSLVIAFIIGITKWRADQARDKVETQSKFNAVNLKNDQQDEHMEFQDDRFEDVGKSLIELSKQISQFGVFDQRLKQLERENDERKEENRLIMRKLDSIYNKMNTIEIGMQNKANR